MKKLFQTLAVLAVLAFAGSASAADVGTEFRVNVPFAFMVGTQQLPAGYYLVQESNSGLLLITGEGTGAAVLSIPAEMTKTGVPTGLVFSKNHLTAVEVSGEGTRSVLSHEAPGRSVALSR